MLINRRRFVLMCATGIVLGFGMPSAFADGGDGSGSGGGGSGGGGSGSGGSGSGGSGSSGSGSGSSGSDGSGSGSGGDDDGGDDDGGDDDDDGGSNSGSGKSKISDEDRAQKAVSSGKAAALTKLKDYLKKNHPGKILKIDLSKRLGNYVYKVRILQAGNRVKSLTLDARTLQTKIF